MTSREEFEKWCGSHKFKTDYIFTFDKSGLPDVFGYYINTVTQALWEAWQEQQREIDDLKWEVLNYRNGYTFVEQRNEIEKQQKKIDELEEERDVYKKEVCNLLQWGSDIVEDVYGFKHNKEGVTNDR